MTMTKGKVNVTHTDKVQELLDSAQQRCRARTVTAEDIQRSVKDIEKKLSGVLFKKDWHGIIAIIDVNAQQFASAYNGIPESTHVMIERSGKNWHVTCAYRAMTASPQNEIVLRFPDGLGEKMAEFVSRSGRW